MHQQWSFQSLKDKIEKVEKLEIFDNISVKAG